MQELRRALHWEFSRVFPLVGRGWKEHVGWQQTWNEPDLYLQTSWFVCVYFISQCWICSYGSLKQSLHYHWKSKCESLTRSSLHSLPLHWSWPQSFQPLLQHVASSHSPLGSSTPRTTGTPPVVVYCSHQVGPSQPQNSHHCLLAPAALVAESKHCRHWSIELGHSLAKQVEWTLKVKWVFVWVVVE